MVEAFGQRFLRPRRRPLWTQTHPPRAQSRCCPSSLDPRPRSDQMLPSTLDPQPPGAGLYVHIPFCLTRCGYCDFNTYAGLDHLRLPYVEALRREAELAAPEWAGTPFVSVFLGGGTPTTLPIEAMARLARRPSGGVRGGRRCRGHVGGEPRHGRRGVPARHARGRRRPAVARAAVLRSGGAAIARAAAFRSVGRRRVPCGAARRLRGREPGPHLRRGGGDARVVAVDAGADGRPRARPRLRLRADDRAGDCIGAQGGRGARARTRRRRAGRHVRGRV